jgi:hypothetical protein
MRTDKLYADALPTHKARGGRESVLALIHPREAVLAACASMHLLTGV